MAKLVTFLTAEGVAAFATPPPPLPGAVPEGGVDVEDGVPAAVKTPPPADTTELGVAGSCCCCCWAWQAANEDKNIDIML